MAFEFEPHPILWCVLFPKFVQTAQSRFSPHFLFLIYALVIVFYGPEYLTYVHFLH